MPTNPFIDLILAVGQISNKALDEAEANIKNIKQVLGGDE